jgi:hypothetical protein
MAQKLKHKEVNSGAPAPGPVVNLPTNCKAEGCKKKSEKMDFCSEHYDWFKWGLLTREGKKPIDFDKKHQAYTKHKKVA